MSPSKPASEMSLGVQRPEWLPHALQRNPTCALQRNLTVFGLVGLRPNAKLLLVERGAPPLVIIR